MPVLPPFRAFSFFRTSVAYCCKIFALPTFSVCQQDFLRLSVVSYFRVLSRFLPFPLFRHFHLFSFSYSNMDFPPFNICCRPILAGFCQFRLSHVFSIFLFSVLKRHFLHLSVISVFQQDFRSSNIFRLSGRFSLPFHRFRLLLFSCFIKISAISASLTFSVLFYLSILLSSRQRFPSFPISVFQQDFCPTHNYFPSFRREAKYAKNHFQQNRYSDFGMVR